MFCVLYYSVASRTNKPFKCDEIRIILGFFFLLLGKSESKMPSLQNVSLEWAEHLQAYSILKIRNFFFAKFQPQRVKVAPSVNFSSFPYFSLCFWLVCLSTKSQMLEKNIQKYICDTKFPFISKAARAEDYVSMVEN